MTNTPTHWLPDLTDVTLALGSPSFDEKLMACLNRILPIDHCAVFNFNPNGQAQHLFTNSRLPRERSETLGQEYASEFFVKDPNFQAVEALYKENVASEVIPLGDPNRYKKDYRDHFFHRNNLIDKASVLVRLHPDAPEKGIVYCNFYRMGDSGRFSRQEWENLKALMPLITALIASHYRLIEAKPKPGGNDPGHRQLAQSKVHTIISRAGSPFDRLTMRERQVTERILLGYTTEAIALDLGIAPTSVATYRQRSYHKLGITSQNDLFTLCLSAVDQSVA